MRSSRRAIRLPASGREACPSEQRSRPSGAVDPLASRTGGGLGAARSIPGSSTTPARVEIRGHEGERSGPSVTHPAPSSPGVFRVLVPVRRLRWTVRSDGCRQFGREWPVTSSRWDAGVRRCAPRRLRLEAALSIAPDLHDHGDLRTGFLTEAVCRHCLRPTRLRPTRRSASKSHRCAHRTRKLGSAIQTAVSCMSARKLSACLPWPLARSPRPPAKVATSQSSANQEAGCPCLSFIPLVSTLQ